MNQKMRRLNIHFSLLFLIMITVLSEPVYSEEKAKVEIGHLLEYINDSGCTFIRNNKEHSGEEAKTHIMRKYNYYKPRIKTTEDFIKYTATKSSISGNIYKVRCNSREIPCADWLRAELQKYRNR